VVEYVGSKPGRKDCEIFGSSGRISVQQQLNYVPADRLEIPINTIIYIDLIESSITTEYKEHC